MELAIILRRLWTLRRWVLVAFLVAVFAAVLSVFRVDFGLPPKLKGRALTYGSGRAQLLIDSPRSSLIDVNTSIDAATTRAQLYSAFMRSSTVTRAIAHDVGIPPSDLYIANASRATTVTQSRIAEQRADALLFEGSRYRLYITVEQGVPLITISGLAPSGAEAARLVRGAASAVTRLIARRERDLLVPPQDRVVVSKLGAPAAGTVNPGVRKQVAVMVLLVAFVIGCMIVLLGANVADGLRRLAGEPNGTPEPLGDL